MSDPSAQTHTNESRRVVSEVESLRAENTQLRTERDRLRELLASLHVKIALPLNDEVADRKAMIAEIDAALTQREPRGQQIWPPVVDSANDSREGGEYGIPR